MDRLAVVLRESTGASDRALEEGLHPTEGSIRAVPRISKNRPAERAARRKVLEGRLRDAHAKVAFETTPPIEHGRTCLAGLMAINIIRAVAYMQGVVPGWSVFGMHFLTTSSDIACIICTAPLFSTGVRGQCVQLGCLGPMLTLVFAMCLVDLSAFGAYLVVARPRPLAAGDRSWVTVMEAVIGVWEFALIASVAFQLALCSSSWRVYKELRVVGLYPPGGDPASVGEPHDVSVFEVMCEAEDVELLADCEVTCGLTSPLMVCPSPKESITTMVKPVPAVAKPAGAKAPHRKQSLVSEGEGAL